MHLGDLHVTRMVVCGSRKQKANLEWTMNDMKVGYGVVLERGEQRNGSFGGVSGGKDVTKRNMRGQSTHQTQSWESVSQATERIRKVAEGKPKEKLTALLHHVTVDALRWAYFSLRRNAAAGVDGVTV